MPMVAPMMTCCITVNMPVAEIGSMAMAGLTTGASTLVMASTRIMRARIGNARVPITGAAMTKPPTRRKGHNHCANSAVSVACDIEMLPMSVSSFPSADETRNGLEQAHGVIAERTEDVGTTQHQHRDRTSSLG